MNSTALNQVFETSVFNNETYSADLQASEILKTDFRRKVYCVLGLPIDALSLEDACAALQSSTRRATRCFLSTPNLNFLMWSHVDRGFRNSVIVSDLCVADGMPLVWISVLMAIPINERIAGSTLFEKIRQDSSNPTSVYIFGGADGAASKAADAINDNPKSAMRCVGHYAPGFGNIAEMSQPHIIEAINNCSPDFLVVALGARKGQEWIMRNLHSLSAPIVSHLGAVVNITAAAISRAPHWMQRSGLEWVWRIKEEPLLWRRYLSDGCGFLGLLVTRVLPAIFYQRCHRISEERLLQSEIFLVRGQESCRITLIGPWDARNSMPVRQTLMDATRTKGDIVVNLRSVEYVDSAIIGIFLLLYGHQSKIGHKVRFENAGRKLTRIFKAHCADYLLEGRLIGDGLRQQQEAAV
ncbi:WecB/TagA/CpsF family glycosyltransferase [Pseudoduganella namucuonensis]|uniref:N-acetylglucosaminyldiphosphoundecaprenol N-acetyl-beta-D-mannosaminyltransferase n=1 Tax=Pseudoduganella namucuonensis TaxID=1035707 RepID=A0A1I7M512_9BURK|nr:WecB/TagA/CpsF family glycosyltransferase [Pseudoduganella namucuonensis]SFV17039.1 N-acetylglucosaminyldiphosphoundecaprenol N-acetyl-beta-D-mannosaminyltransferase [Pseudoduganella namucuonensis]